MLPYIQLFGRQIPMYGVCVLLGLCAVLLYILLRRKHFSVHEADAELILISAAVGALVGAKVLYLLTVLPELIADLSLPDATFRQIFAQYGQGGFVFYGGFFGGLLAAWIYCKVAKVSFSAALTDLAAVIPLFHAFGRLGCFCVGCCYGCPVSHGGIAFSVSPVAPNHVPLLPVQLIEAGAEFALFFVMAAMSGKRVNGKIILSVWMLAYGALRFSLEFFRADTYRGFLCGLSVSQWLSLATVLMGVFLLLFHRAACRKAQPSAP